ncbi:MAG: heavy metal-binding domain-containing protein [Verrucomicrobiota bacterium]
MRHGPGAQPRLRRAHRHGLHLPDASGDPPGHPGSCPICGMALEPVVASAGAEEDDNAELRDMSRRFWIGLVLTVPVFRARHG